MLHDNLVQLSEHFQIFNDVTVLVRDQDQEELLNWHVHVPDHVSLNVRALLARVDELWEVCHVLFELEAIYRDKLTCEKNFAPLGADRSANDYHVLVN